MSADFERLIGRAVLDDDFRAKLVADPEGTVKNAGFSLSADELDRVKKAAENAKSNNTLSSFDTMKGAALWF